jgi:hypothetical protein
MTERGTFTVPSNFHMDRVCGIGFKGVTAIFFKKNLPAAQEFRDRKNSIHMKVAWYLLPHVPS